MDQVRALKPLQWTLLDFGDLAVCVHALSQSMPADARILVLPAPPSGDASRLALELVTAEGRRRLFSLAAMSAASVGAVAMAASVVVVEEDAATPSGRRHAYVARVVQVAARMSRAAAAVPARVRP
jgi:hypothetical protein